MKRLQLFVFTLLLIGFGSISSVYAQEEKKEIDHSYKPMTLKMSEDGSKYMRFITWQQFWLTSQNLSNNNADFKVSPSISRSRLLWFVQAFSKFIILIHIYLNDLNFSNMIITGVQGNGSQMFLHDGCLGRIQIARCGVCRWWFALLERHESFGKFFNAEFHDLRCNNTFCGLAFFGSNRPICSTHGRLFQRTSRQI